MAAQYCCKHPLLQPATTTTTNSSQLLSPTLPEELIIDILLRLPVRSLLQFRSVCKSWKTLIYDPKFANTHLQISNTDTNSMTNQKLLLYEDPYKIQMYPMKSLFEKTPNSFITEVKNQYIIGSCNGLLCLFNILRAHARLWNPSTSFKPKNSPKAVLPWKYIIAYYGFGFDQINDKYKVLIVFQSKSVSSENLTKVYTFGDDSWKTIQNFQPGSLTRKLGKFVSGTLNWIVDKSGESVILSFDLAKEAYVEVLLPRNDGGEEVCTHRILCVLSNCLCVCDTFVSKEKYHWVVWLMKEYGVIESWTKLMIIPCQEFIGKSIVEPFFFSKNDFVLLWNISSSEFILYKLNSGQFDYSLINSSIGTSIVRVSRYWDRYQLILHVHRESLVSPRW